MSEQKIRKTKWSEIMRLTAENAGLKNHLAREKRKNKALKKIVIEKLYFLLEGYDTQIRMFYRHKSESTDENEVLRLTLLMNCVSNCRGEISDIIAQYKDAMKCVW